MKDFIHLDEQFYSLISTSRNGASVAAIAKTFRMDVYEARRIMLSSPLITELCYKNSKDIYYSLISGRFPHTGLDHFSLYCSSVGELVSCPPELFQEQLADNASQKVRLIGTERVDARISNLIRCTMLGMFTDIHMMSEKTDYSKWQIAFYPEVSIPGGEVKCSCDVLLITGKAAFAFAFENSGSISERKIRKLSESSSDFEKLLGPKCRIYPAAVLLKGSGIYEHVDKIPVCSREMIYNIPDEVLRYLKH